MSNLSCSQLVVCMTNYCQLVALMHQPTQACLCIYLKNCCDSKVVWKTTQGCNHLCIIIFKYINLEIKVQNFQEKKKKNTIKNLFRHFEFLIKLLKDNFLLQRVSFHSSVSVSVLSPFINAPPMPWQKSWAATSGTAPATQGQTPPLWRSASRTDVIENSGSTQIDSGGVHYPSNPVDVSTWYSIGRFSDSHIKLMKPPAALTTAL